MSIRPSGPCSCGTRDFLRHTGIKGVRGRTANIAEENILGWADQLRAAVHTRPGGYASELQLNPIMATRDQAASPKRFQAAIDLDASQAPPSFEYIVQVMPLQMRQ